MYARVLLDDDLLLLLLIIQHSFIPPLTGCIQLAGSLLPTMKPSGAPASALAEEEGVAAGVTAASTPVHTPTYTALATFASAGLGNVLSATVTNPFDVIKIRQQLLFDRSRANFISVTRGMLANEGVVGLWAGVTASCLREGTYSTIRMGGYEPCKRMIGTVIPETTFANKLAAGVVSGAVGAALSTPTDLMKVRMQAARGPSNRPPYRTTFHGFAEVYSSGGLKALWRGVYPNTIRAAILTSSQIATYDEVKGWFKRTLGFTEGFRLHFSASMVAG